VSELRDATPLVRRALVIAALALAGWVWLSTRAAMPARPRCIDGRAAAAPVAPVASPDGAAARAAAPAALIADEAGRPPRQPPSLRGERQPLAVEHAAARAQSADAQHAALVAVRGTVRRGGRAVPDLDLWFDGGGMGPARGPRGSDWDFTDARGGYEVELPPGAYEVQGGAGELELWARFDVPAGAGELTVDFDLPR
jgi:hypothetical protein